jgi:hypothetical protein
MNKKKEKGELKGCQNNLSQQLGSREVARPTTTT